MTPSLEGKVALVTGGAMGIGRAAALALARAGAAVVVADIAASEGEEAAHAIAQEGRRAIFVRCDVSVKEDVVALVEAARAAYGRLDCAFNAAGIEGDWVPTADADEDNWERVLRVNLTGVWLCMKYEMRQMLSQQPAGGAIVNAGSVAGMIAERGLPAYSAAKGGVLALTRSAAAEYARLGIRINAVCPGGVRTPMVERSLDHLRVEALFPEMARGPRLRRAITGALMNQRWLKGAMLRFAHPIGRLGEPEEVAGAVVWLCSESAGFVTGHALVIDGGMTIV